MIFSKRYRFTSSKSISSAGSRRTDRGPGSVDIGVICARVVSSTSATGVPLGLVTVQQPFRCPAVDRGGQLPAQVERVLHAEVEALPAGRRVDVRRVTGQQHPPVPVALGLPGGVAEPGQPTRRVPPEVGARDGHHPPLELLEGGRGRAVPGQPLGGHEDAVPPVPEGHRAEE